MRTALITDCVCTWFYNSARISFFDMQYHISMITIRVKIFCLKPMQIFAFLSLHDNFFGVFFRFCPPPSGLGICQRLDRRSGDSLWLVLSRFKRGAMPLLWYVDIEHRLLLAAVTCFIYSRDLPRKTTWNILYTEWSTLLKNYLTTASKLSWTFF